MARTQWLRELAGEERMRQGRSRVADDQLAPEIIKAASKLRTVDCEPLPVGR